MDPIEFADEQLDEGATQFTGEEYSQYLEAISSAAKMRLEELEEEEEV